MTPTPNPEVHTLAGPYVVNAVSDIERRQFERHLAECPSCTEEVESLREVVAVFAGAVAEAPPAHLRERVLARTTGTRRVPPVVPERESGQPMRLLRRVAMPVAAGLLIVVTVSAVVFGYQTGSTNADLNHQLDVLKQTQGGNAAVADLMSRPDAKVLRQPVPGGAATIVYSPSAHQAAMLGTAMPTAPSQHTYQGWLIRDHNPQPLGLTSGGNEAGAIVVQGIAPGDKFAVTVEPASGSAKPTTPPIVKVALT